MSNEYSSLTVEFLRFLTNCFTDYFQIFSHIFISKVSTYLPKYRRFLLKNRRYLPKYRRYLPKCRRYLPKNRRYLPKYRRYLPKCRRYLQKYRCYLYVYVQMYMYKCICTNIMKYWTPMKSYKHSFQSTLSH